MSATLRKAIVSSGKSYYEISKATGVPHTSVMRFVTGQTSLRLDRAGLVAEYLGLRLVERAKRRKSRG